MFHQSSNMSNESNNTLLYEDYGEEPDMPLDIIIIGTFFYSMIFMVGVIGNLLVISVLLIEKDLRNFTNYLLANLSIADLLVLLTNVPTGLHDLFAKERWYLGSTMCYLTSFIENSCCIASVVSIFFITLERYFVICHPLSAKAIWTQSRTLKLILLIWLFAFLVNTPMIFMTEYKLGVFWNNEEEYECLTHAEGWRKVYTILVTFVFYLIIGVFILWMYAGISRNLKKSNKMLFTSSHIRNNAVDDADSSFNKQSKKSKSNKKQKSESKPLAENEHTSERQQQQQPQQQQSTATVRNNNNNADFDRFIKPRKQLIKMLMCVIIVFYVCLFPLRIWSLVLILGGRYVYSVVTLREFWYINVICRIFYYANNSINPILYNWLSAKFRAGFKRFVTCQRTLPNESKNKSQANRH